MTNIVVIRKFMLVCVNDWKRYWVATIPGIWYLGPSLHRPTHWMWAFPCPLGMRVNLMKMTANNLKWSLDKCASPMSVFENTSFDWDKMIRLVMWMLEVMVNSLSLKNVKEGMSACLDRANLIFCHRGDVDDCFGSGHPLHIIIIICRVYCPHYNRPGHQGCYGT